MIKRDPFEVYNSLSGSDKRRPLDWDESAADSTSAVEDVYDSDRRPPSLVWLATVLLGVFVVLGARLFYLQIIQGQRFYSLAENNRIRRQTILAPRGKILDSHGKVLAENRANFNLVAVPFDLPKQGLEPEITELSSRFGLDENALRKTLAAAPKNSLEPIIIKSNMSQDESLLFETLAQQFVGFSTQKIPVRDYANAAAFSHVLGYTGLVATGDLEDIDSSVYASEDFIGKLGIEKQYEKYLHGENGENLVEVNASGKILDILGEDPSGPGNILVLNIDKDLQEILYKGLQENIGSKRGAAIAMDPRNGKILALVSSPGFDTNLFAPGISQADYQALLSDKNQPLFNRAVSGTYPPGSTSKLITATAGLEVGIINDKTVIVDNGVITVPNQFGGPSYQFRGWKLSGLGPMTVRSAIAQSSDIFFYEVAGGPPNGAWPGLGPDRLADFFRKFGLGKPLGIDVGGEKPGLVPDPAWKMEYFKNDPLAGKWYLGDTYHIGIGQGDLLVTPLQVAQWTAVVANGGIGFVPQIGQKVMDQNGKVLWESQPKVLLKDIASPANIKIVQEGMRQTVLSGTARALNKLNISSAGKTGTSQFDGSNPLRTHAWFTAYSPYEDPQIVITVLVEAGGEGNAAAEPIAEKALKWWAENRYNK